MHSVWEVLYRCDTRFARLPLTSCASSSCCQAHIMLKLVALFIANPPTPQGTGRCG